MISYEKFFLLLKAKGMTREDARSEIGIFPKTFAAMRKGEHCSMETIDKICSYFYCQPNDIMEWIPERETGATNKRIMEIKKQIEQLSTSVLILENELRER